MSQKGCNMSSNLQDQDGTRRLGACLQAVSLGALGVHVPNPDMSCLSIRPAFESVWSESGTTGFPEVAKVEALEQWTLERAGSPDSRRNGRGGRSKRQDLPRRPTPVVNVASTRQRLQSRTRASPSFSCDPSAPPFLSRQRQPEVAEGKHSHHRTPWALSGTPGDPPAFFCCASAACPFFHFIPWLGSIPSLPVITTTTSPPHHHPTSPFLLCVSLDGPFSSYFPSLPTVADSSLAEVGDIDPFSSHRISSLPSAEAALMGTYHAPHHHHLEALDCRRPFWCLLVWERRCPCCLLSF
ncbi:hypothetical protein QBC39DRAFT_170035 [Podospora conica]|nr:hypothetical protein QBC39DRAFT_170035 [Schizothecium conicum]